METSDLVPSQDLSDLQGEGDNGEQRGGGGPGGGVRSSTSSTAPPFPAGGGAVVRLLGRRSVFSLEESIAFTPCGFFLSLHSKVI